MATLTPTLTLVSTNALTDSLSISETDTLTVTNPAEMSRVSVLHTGAGTEFAAAGSGTHYIYAKNIGTNSRTVQLRTAGGTAFCELAPGEFCFVPLLDDGGVEALSLVGTETVEYAIFKKS